MKSLEKNWVKVKGIKTHYLTAGKGSPLILLHGAASTANLTYASNIDFLSRSHLVIAPDLPGCGESDKPKINYTTPYYIEFLKGFMKAQKLTKAHLLGASMGGGIVLGFSLKYPQMVGKLVLVSSYGLTNKTSMPLVFFSLSRLFLSLNKLGLQINWNKALVRWFLGNVFYDIQSISQKEIDGYYQTVKSPESFWAFLTWLKDESLLFGNKTDLSKHFHKVKTPTLFLHGEEDKLIPVSSAKKAQQKIKGAKIHLFSKCGHCPTREKRGKFNRLVLKFLAS